MKKFKLIILHLIALALIISAGIVIMSRVVFKFISKVKNNYLREYKEFNREDIKDLFIISRDNVRLHGTLIRADDESKLCVMLIHGIGDRSIIQAEKIAKFYHDRNVHLLLTDQRGYGLSKGEYTTYGALEAKDHMAWLNIIREELGEDVKIILHGLSMGAATALIMCKYELPRNVKAVVSDSSFSTANGMLKRTFDRKNYQKDIFYYLYKTGCFNGSVYDPERTRPVDGAANLNLPVIFAHSEDDTIVPFEMAEELYEVCPSINKKFVSVPGDNHSYCFELSQEMRGLVEKMIKKLK